VVAKLSSSLKGLATATGGAYLAALLPPPDICVDVLHTVTALTVQVTSPFVHVFVDVIQELCCCSDCTGMPPPAATLELALNLYCSQRAPSQANSMPAA
jgi:hypothetical protein